MLRSRPFSLLLAVAAVLVLTLGVTACGGGDKATDLTADQVVQKYFANGNKVKSGKLDLSLKVNTKGNGQDGTLDASLVGPFQSQGKEFPKFGLTGKVKASGSAAKNLPQSEIEAGVTSTGDRGFVTYNKQAYEADAATFGLIKSSYTNAQAQQTATNGNQALDQLKKLGIDPKTWIKDPQKTTEADAVVAKGEVDTDKVAQDIADASNRAGSLGLSSGTKPPSQADIDKFKNAIKGSSIEIGIGQDDELPRTLKFDIDLANPDKGAGQPAEVTLTFNLTYSAVNEDQTITTPPNPKPLSELTKSTGLGSALGGGLGAGSSSSGSSSSSPFGSSPGGSSGSSSSGGSSSGGSSSSSGGSSAANEAYLKCIQKASTPDQLSACSSKAP